MTVAIFTSRTCPACGWHETKRYAGSSCFVCRGPMDPKLSELLELWRKRAAHGAQLAAAMPPGEIPAKDAPRLAAYMAAADNWTKAADELERVIREAAAGELSRIARAGLTEAQDDGRACVRCGLEGLPMLPTGKRGSHGAQLFECERHYASARQARSARGRTQRVIA